MVPTIPYQPTVFAPNAAAPSVAAALSLARYKMQAAPPAERDAVLSRFGSLPPEEFPETAAAARAEADLLLGFGVALPCQRPIVVRRTASDGSFEDVTIRCGNRRHAACPSCAALYRGDVKKILRAGLDMAASSGEQLVFLTLSAPSFGAVHHVPKPPPPRLGAAQRKRWAAQYRRKCRCGAYHAVRDDGLRGVPVDPSAYDYEGQNHWNSYVGQLFSRTMDRLARQLGRDPETGRYRRPAYACVAEFQARGAVHFHVLLRLPAGFALDVYTDVRGRRSRRLEALVGEVRAYGGPRRTGEEFRWGAQVVADVLGDSESRSRTAGYVAKLLSYTTKDLSSGLDGRAYSPERSAHQRWLDQCAEEVCGCGTRCAGVGRCSKPGHRARGFGGHVQRRSRTWSPVTLGSLRAHRRAWAAERSGASTSSDPAELVAWEFVRQERRPEWTCSRARAGRLRAHADEVEFLEALGVT